VGLAVQSIGVRAGSGLSESVRLNRVRVARSRARGHGPHETKAWARGTQGLRSHDGWLGRSIRSLDLDDVSLIHHLRR
jgi:hypothetical protein